MVQISGKLTNDTTTVEVNLEDIIEQLESSGYEVTIKKRKIELTPTGKTTDSI